jgi:formiminoglutamate deiminase
VTAFWCERAWLGADGVRDGVLVDVAGGQIRGVIRDLPLPPAGSERLAGLVIPGLANSHSHCFQRALRGRTQSARGSFWTWREQMYELARRLDPESMLALAGVTLAGEFHYLHHGSGGTPYADLNAMGTAVIQAAQEAGVRLTLLDACYLHGGIGTAPSAAQRRFCDRDIDAWVARVDRLEDGPQVRQGAAIHSVRAVDPDAAKVVAEWTKARLAPLHAHVSEQRDENEACLAAYGATPTAVLAQAGALSRRFTAVHATHVSVEDVLLLGRAGAYCCLCPTTERDLADGIGPAKRLRDGGAKLTLGSDSNALIEPFEEARAVELDERLATGVRGQHGAAGLLGAASANGYASLGWPDGGEIRPGGLADFVAVRLDSVRLAGAPPGELVDAVVFAGAAADVRDVVVDGRFVVRDGAHTSIDVASELSSAIEGLVA